MKTHFSKIHRFMVIRSILCPLLTLASYFTYIYFFQLGAIILIALSFLLFYAFPNKREEDPEDFKDTGAFFRNKSLETIFSYFPCVFFIFWIFQNSEFTNLIDNLLTKEALSHWSIMIAIIGWSILWGYSEYNKVSKLKDSDILSIYDSYNDSTSKPKKMQNKSQ